MVSDGATKDLIIRMILEVDNASSVTLKIDPTTVIATKKDIEILDNKIKNIKIPVTKVNNKLGDVTLKAEDIKANNDKTIEENLQEVTSQMDDMAYKVAGGTATEITVTAPSLTDGYSKTFIVLANNNESATTINGKPLYKPNTTTSPNLMSGKAVTVWYSSEGNCFFIKASAEGNADVANVLAGKTFSNDNDTGIIGTMPNRGSLAQTLTTQGGQYNLPSGYYSGGYVKAQFSNLIASNIKEGINIGGVIGTLASNNAYIQKIDVDISDTIDEESNKTVKYKYYTIDTTLHSSVKFLLLKGYMYAQYDGTDYGSMNFQLGYSSPFTEIASCQGGTTGRGGIDFFMTMMSDVNTALTIKNEYVNGKSSEWRKDNYQRDFSKIGNSKLYMRMQGSSYGRLKGQCRIKGTIYAIGW
nr:phage tail protein [Clostridium argentinense]